MPACYVPINFHYYFLMAQAGCQVGKANKKGILGCEVPSPLGKEKMERKLQFPAVTTVKEEEKRERLKKLPEKIGGT